ncbi:MAG: hypothetical protein VX223_17930 [Myxococcota bacterium]|nr:hypothetical protein [Myxococcota bacterium]
MKRTRTLSAMLLLTTMASGCNSEQHRAAATTTATSPTALSIRLHQTLVGYAVAKDEAGFQSLLTDQSIQMLNHYFAATRIVDENNEAASGWSEFLEEHAQLPKEAFMRAPYPVIYVAGQAKLALEQHQDSDFFRQFIQDAKRVSERNRNSKTSRND